MTREIRMLAIAAFDKSISFDFDEMIPFLKNYYPIDEDNYPHVKYFDPENTEINIGCFGAFRQLKNHLIQAVAAIEFAEKNNFKLNFHINVGRMEQNGNNPYKNVKNIFNMLPQYSLIEHP